MVNKRSKYHTGEKYITHNRYGYVLYKQINGKRKYFGTFKTLEDAIRYREYCISHDWDLRCQRKQVNRLFTISEMEMLEERVIVYDD